MEIGIIGLQQSGKSTLFQIMTGVKSRENFTDPYVRGIAKVPDPRFNKLVEIFKPAKVTPASVPFIDVNASGENAWDQIRKTLGGIDGILHVVDAFTANGIDEVVKHYNTLKDELIISDLIVVENRLERLQKLPAKSLKPDEASQLKILTQAKELLEKGEPLKNLSLNAEQKNSLRGFGFWSLRPELVVVNTAEGNASLGSELAKTIKVPAVSICCKIEAEIAELEPHEQKEFLASMGIDSPAFERIIQESFRLLGQMCYFTVGEDEVRAWVIPAGSTAPRASSAIHKDFERGFIKAEVVAYDDFISCGGTVSGAKSAGKFRLEGKEYIVQDGDIISFRFNV